MPRWPAALDERLRPELPPIRPFDVTGEVDATWLAAVGALVGYFASQSERYVRLRSVSRPAH